jgi:hypothetical protein
MCNIHYIIHCAVAKTLHNTQYITQPTAKVRYTIFSIQFVILYIIQQLSYLHIYDVKCTVDIQCTLYYTAYVAEYRVHIQWTYNVYTII